MSQLIRRLYWCALVASTASLMCMAPAQAQADALTRAEVYSLQNDVRLLLRNQAPRAARVEDVLVPLDALQTGTSSRAELLFNEGSLARLGSNAVFRFVPGVRRFQLPNGEIRAETIFQLRSGIALITSPAGGLSTRVETPGGQIEFLAATLPPPPLGDEPAPGEPVALSQTTAALVLYDPAQNQLQVFALTNNITVFGLDGLPITLLQGGQSISVINGIPGPIQHFDLSTFYNTSILAAGLGPGQEGMVLQSPLPIQQALNAVRPATLAAVAAQARWLEGLCTLNGRGGDSTLATNCITTDADDPLSRFESHREDVLRDSQERPNPEPNPQPQPEPRPEPQPEPRPEPRPEPQPEPQPEPRPDPNPNMPGPNDPGPNNPGPNNPVPGLI